uniref:N-acetylglucosamine-1-phosphodiester alpha-N-acetylglucosaminidase-like n=1 Tax=Crassostrea virginica TaxID=6565 RepID=A0A8B8AFS4_CRAVI|nr:N-acetylglucosamine-1-phosphodiester alpha-N-acetylglucosaminidase-like [Crassostrea virginica]
MLQCCNLLKDMSPLIVFYVYVLCIVVCFIDNCVGNSASTDDQCDGRYKGCCEGFKHDVTMDRCIECKVGYFGENCSLQCPYNTYGKDCQQFCLCSEDECDNQRGCRNEKDDTHREDTQGISKVTTYTILRKSMAGLVFLLIFVMIAYMLLFVFQKLTVRRVIPSFDVENKENGSRGKVDN